MLSMLYEIAKKEKYIKPAPPEENDKKQQQRATLTGTQMMFNCIQKQN